MLTGSRPSTAVVAVAISGLLLAVRDQAGLAEVDDLRAAVGVLQLRDLDVPGRDAGRANAAAAASIDGLVRSPGDSHGEKTSNEPGRPAAQRHRGQPDRRVAQVEGARPAGEDERDRTGIGRAEHEAREGVVDHVRVHRLVDR